MNSRTVKILHILMQEAETISNLARRFDVSENMIKHDLDSINDFLYSNRCKSLMVDDNGNIRADLTVKQLHNLFGLLDFYDNKLTEIERRALISYILLCSKKPVAIKVLTSLLFVSRSTIYKDLENIKRDLFCNGIIISQSRNKGLKVEGEERTIRNYLQILLEKEAFPLERYDKLECFINVEPSFSSYERSILEEIINEQLHSHNLKITEALIKSLRSFVEIQVKRNRNDFYLNKETITSPDNHLASELYDLVLYYFKIKESKAERAYLNNFVNGLAIKAVSV